eukprot:scaffold15230_cov51-Isochrysis_galbana.AAC.1
MLPHLYIPRHQAGRDVASHGGPVDEGGVHGGHGPELAHEHVADGSEVGAADRDVVPAVVI